MQAPKSFVAILLLTSASSAYAQDASNRFYAKGGVFFAKVDSTLRLDGTLGRLGTNVDLETDLGLDVNETMPLGLIGWTFAKNWGVELEYFKLARNNVRTLDRSLTIGDTTYDAEASLQSRLATEVFRLSINHSFISGENFDFGGNLGAHLSNFEVSAEGSGSVNGISGAFSNERREQLVPLPTFGLYGNYDINKTFSLAGRISYFQLKIDRYKGELIDASVGINAKINKNIGVGADFRYVDYELGATARDFTGRINYRFYGPFLYAMVGF
jgi:hypothetical protein